MLYKHEFYWVYWQEDALPWSLWTQTNAPFLQNDFSLPLYSCADLYLHIHDMIGKTGMVDSFDVSLSSSFIRKKLELSETSKLSTIPVLPIMSLFNQFSTRSVNTHPRVWSFWTLKCQYSRQERDCPVLIHVKISPTPNHDSTKSQTKIATCEIPRHNRHFISKGTVRIRL